MNLTDAIGHGLDFVESHLQEPIAVGNMASHCGYSLYYFCRVFNALTHSTPYDYLMRRRLACAAAELTGSSRRIIDIALDYQFNSPEVFSRAFKRVYMQQPQQYRATKNSDPRLNLSRITTEHLHFWRECNYFQPEPCAGSGDLQGADPGVHLLSFCSCTAQPTMPSEPAMPDCVNFWFTPDPQTDQLVWDYLFGIWYFNHGYLLPEWGMMDVQEQPARITLPITPLPGAPNI